MKLIAAAFALGLIIIGLGFATGSPEAPPKQAILFGGMFLICAGYGRMWKWHGIGAATVIALLASISFVDAAVVGGKMMLDGQAMPKAIIGQTIALVLTTTYFIVAGRALLREMKTRPVPGEGGE